MTSTSGITFQWHEGSFSSQSAYQPSTFQFSPTDAIDPIEWLLASAGVPPMSAQLQATDLGIDPFPSATSSRCDLAQTMTYVGVASEPGDLLLHFF